MSNLPGFPADFDPGPPPAGQEFIPHALNGAYGKNQPEAKPARGVSAFLNDHDIQIGRQCARERQDGAQRAGYRPNAGLKGDYQSLLAKHEQGAWGEIAFAKSLGCSTEKIVELKRRGIMLHVNTFRKKPDVGPFEVRTGTKSWYRLLVRPDDDDERPWVLVIPCSPPRSYRVLGWLLGREAKREEWLESLTNGRPDIYLPPQSALHELSEIPPALLSFLKG